MKKLLVASALALALVSATTQSASAWCNFKFSIGMNIDYSGGNNCWFWGLFHNGPTPDCGYYPYAAYAPAQSWNAYQPNFQAPAPTPNNNQKQSAPATAGAQYAGYGASYYYYPASYSQGASYYPMSYSHYYPMNYGYGYPYGFSFYGQ